MNKKVALYANGWNAENIDLFIKGVRENLSEDGYDLFVFTSTAAYSMSEKERDAENSIYFMADISTFDAAIIYASGINSNSVLNRLISECKKADIPFVVQGYFSQEAINVTVDNYAGMRSLADHIIEEHDVKNIKFIAGPKDNADSNVRIRAVRESMGAHGLELKEEDILYANWERSVINEFVTEEYHLKKKPLPDAIVCANDPMALFTLMSLEAYGYSAPKDVIVTGFDNISDGRVFYPSLASVDQCYYEQGFECGKVIANDLKGNKTIKNVVIPCAVTPGESCGCMNCKNEAEVRKLIGHDAMYKKFIEENLRGRESHLDMCILSSENYDKIPEKIRTDLFANVGEEGDDFHIFLNPQYSKLVYMEDDADINEFDKHFNPYMDVLASKTNGVVNKDTTIYVNDLFPGYTGEGKGKTYVFSQLRLGAYSIGYMVLGYKSGDFADSKFNGFASGLNRTLEKYQMNIKMVVLNEKLSELMQKDSLTNVKNRIAYDNYLTKMDSAISKNENMQISIVMCDINNLKTINDSFGHDAGDVYIKNCCRLMCETFKCSPIFRTGGDEFVIVISTADFDVRNERLEEMRKRMDEIAASECSPLANISIATGIADLDVTKDKSLADTVKRADAFMYINKAEMKAKLL